VSESVSSVMVMSTAAHAKTACLKAYCKANNNRASRSASDTLVETNVVDQCIAQPNTTLHDCILYLTQYL